MDIQSHPADVAQQRVARVAKAIGRADKRPLKIAALGAGAWGAVFAAMLQQAYGIHPHLVDVCVWRRAGRKVDKDTIASLIDVINAHEDVLRRLRNSAVYLKYVGARLGDRQLTADELLRDGFCLNLPGQPLCPLKVVTDLDECIYDADIIINGLPSTETRSLFSRVAKSLNATSSVGSPYPVVVSLSKGVEARTEPHPHVVTPTRMIHETTGIPLTHILYLGGPNIASEIWRGEYATARICGEDKDIRQALAEFFRTPNFVVWDNDDVITHEVMGGLKNVYAIGMGIVTAATNNSATSKAVYFSNAAAEMVFITRMLSAHPDDLHGPLLADTYVTLLKGRNAWYGEQAGMGRLHPKDGDLIPEKGLIQGISAVHAFFELFNDHRIEVYDRNLQRMVRPAEILPTLRMLQVFLSHEGDMKDAAEEFIESLKDASAADPARRLRSKDLHLPYLTRLPEETNGQQAGTANGIESSENFTLSAETRAFMGRRRESQKTTALV